jgi:AAA+ ATPase superfamily predicted ATPase
MGTFVGRQRELDELDEILARGDAQLLLVYGRRRMGKTTLILRWAQQTGRAHADVGPVIYWVATRDTPAQVRLGLTQALWAWAYPGSQAVPRFDTWSEVFDIAAQLIDDQPVILIMDEFSYAAESDRPCRPIYRPPGITCSGTATRRSY